MDEVITALEMCTADKCICLSGCSYSYLAAGEDSCEYHAIPAMQTDALYYLKDYRMLAADFAEKRKDLEAEKARYQEAIRNCEAAENKYHQLSEELRKTSAELGNEPLTWDELREMKGKPVWICLGNECDNHDLWGGMWRIIGTFTGRNDELACMTTLEKYPDSFWKKSMGKTWQAYRKERE